MGFAVWKLGGSLLDLPELAERMRQLYAQQSPALPVVIIPGGGMFADSVRKMDQVHRLDALVSHQLALHAMRLSASLVAALLQQSVVSDLEAQQFAIQSWKQGHHEPAIQVWDVIDSWNTQLPSIEETCGEIPTDWRLTSDSIAAALAANWGAQKLVLVKSIDRPADASWDALAKDGAVDELFPQIAPYVKRIVWANLRAQ
ncbi:Amino acid kinase family protein [Bremerella volcania]|uniref:Amino acid kinase family protein n=1 Tax=Bremerella volcania TaxID=2527984 RepID=A0A518C7K7_9BACT|nr:uridylate kinase [Bremerella volcania]QDU75194.1 Amino acid kinase family protein [Bremerella volcania]